MRTTSYALMNTKMVNVMDILTFKISSEQYAVALDDLDEVLLMAAVKPVPGSPAFIKGVLNLRGELLPVIDLAERLGLCRDAQQVQADDSPYSASTRMMLVTLKDGYRVVAILDGWSGLQNLDETALFDGVVTPEASPDYIDGIGLEGGEMLQMVLIKNILSTDELTQLRQNK